jgi:hypothetical protein
MKSKEAFKKLVKTRAKELALMQLRVKNPNISQ